jgi:hypothetical protein
MELLVIVLVILGLGLFDVLAMRFGTDSRATGEQRRNWW